MTAANLQPGFRLHTGEEINSAINNASVTGPTGSTGPTGPTGAQGAASGSAPANAGSTGTAGQIAYDSTHIYVCVATNTWCRATIATW